MYICNYCFCVSVGSANEMKELEKRFEEESWTPFLAEGWFMYAYMFMYTLHVLYTAAYKTVS